MPSWDRQGPHNASLLSCYTMQAVVKWPYKNCKGAVWGRTPVRGVSPVGQSVGRSVGLLLI